MAFWLVDWLVGWLDRWFVIKICLGFFFLKIWDNSLSCKNLGFLSPLGQSYKYYKIGTIFRVT